jgi:branched-chain amino acid transport system permease protein
VVLISVVINGVLLGLIYALFAVGLTISLGVMRVFNVAYGALITFAVIEGAGQLVGAPYLVVVLIAVVAGAAMAAAIELVAVWPIQRRSVNTDLRAEMTLLTTLAAWLILVGINSQQTGTASYKAFPRNPLLSSGIILGDLHIQTGYVLGAAAVILVVVLTWLIVQRTQVGRSLRAIATNVAMAELIGINVRTYSTASAVITGALGGLAGALLATIFVSFDTSFGDQFFVRGFEVVVVAGLGSILGTLVGGVGLGLTETLIAYYGGGAWTTAGGVVLIALILILRPNGLFGRQEVGRA